jgi:RimJ/RimL family protein N-acetyltransferase
MPWTVPNTEAELWNMFEKLHTQRGFIIYAIKANLDHVNPLKNGISTQHIVLKHSEVLGTIGYLEVQPQHRALETGAVLFGPSLRRTAAATEAHYLLLKNVCDQDPLSSSPPYRRIAWKCNSLNHKSRRAAERIGYRYEGTFRNHMISKGRSRSSDWLSITDEEWPAVKTDLELWLDPTNFDQDGRQVKTLDEVRAATS